MTILMYEEDNTEDMKMLQQAHDWQSQAFIQWFSTAPQATKMNVLLRRMTIKAITGSGKTYLAVMMAVHHLRKSDNSRVVVVVPSVGLLNQWMSILSGWNIGNVSGCGGGYRYDAFSPIVVTTKDSLKKLRGHRNLMLGDTFFILDECHNMAAPKAYDTLEKMIKMGMIQSIVGLSATPERTDGRCIMNITGRNSKGEPHVVYAYDDALADKTVIPNFTVNVGRISRTLLAHETYTPTSVDDSYIGNKLQVLDAMTTNISKMAASLSKALAEIGVGNNGGGGVNLMHHDCSNPMQAGDLAYQVQAWKQLCIKRKRLLNNADIRITIAKQFAEKNLGIKQAIFHESIAGIEKIATTLREELGIEPFIYHSGESVADWDLLTHDEKERLATYKANSQEILAQWIRSDSGVLLTCKALKEGLNVPDMGAVLLLSHPNAARPTIQTLGRALRGDRHDDGTFISDKEIWIINFDVAADDRVIANIKDTGQIPDSQFKYFTRNANGTWDSTGDVVMDYDTSQEGPADEQEGPADESQEGPAYEGPTTPSNNGETNEE